MVKLVFWMNMPSFYQADLFRALLRTGEVRLKVMFTNRIPEDRAKLGWQDDLEGFDHEFLNPHHPVSDTMAKAFEYRDRVHITGGPWSGRISEILLAALWLFHSNYFIYSESPDQTIPASPLNRKVLLTLGKPFVKRATGFLPISHFASDYFRSYGAAESKLHPFGYFRSSPAIPSQPAVLKAKKTVDLVYVGQLVRRKGLDILLSAMEPLFAVYGNLHLQLIGSGEMRTELEDWVKNRRLTGRVDFEGTVSPRQITTRISRADMLVLPSRWDGWGLVVNEALMAGIPVVVSDMCGAADVIRDGVNGYVFRSEEVEELRSKIETFVKNENLRASFSEAALKTGKALEAENAARYLLDVLKGREIVREEAPVRPWTTH